MTTPKIERKVEKTWSDPQCKLQIEDSGDGRIKLLATMQNGTTHGFECGLSSLLELLIALWPDEIAYVPNTDNDT